MSIMIREYFGFNGFEVDFNYQGKESLLLTEAYEALTQFDPESIMVDIEGIHAIPTRNHTRYKDVALKNSVPSWTAPYLKPVIKHHNEKDGDIIGRIHSVQYISNCKTSNSAALLFTCNIPDEDGKKQVKDSRLLTTSIGVVGHDVRCSICGHQVADYGPCENHERGQKYADSVAFWDVYNFEGKEISYVVVPSDPYSKNVKVYLPKHYKQEAPHIGENLTEGVLPVALEKDPIVPVVDPTVTPVVDPPVADPSIADKITGLLKQIEDLKIVKEALELEKQGWETIKKDLEEAKIILEGEKTKAAQELQKLKEEFEAIVKSLGAAKDDNVLKEAAAIQDRQLREQVETTLAETKKQFKAHLCETYNLMRKTFGKSEMNAVDLAERSEASLVDAINDIKAECHLTTPTPVKNPTIVESTEPTNVIGDKSNSNIDLKESLNSLLDSTLSFHTRGR